jgi:hypothetical protein
MKDPGSVELGGGSGERVGYTDPVSKFTGRLDEVKIYKGELRLIDILENL